MQYETIYTGRESYDKNSYMDKPVKALETAVHNNQPFNQNIYDSVQGTINQLIHEITPVGTPDPTGRDGSLRACGTCTSKCGHKCCRTEILPQDQPCVDANNAKVKDKTDQIKRIQSYQEQYVKQHLMLQEAEAKRQQQIIIDQKIAEAVAQQMQMIPKPEPKPQPVTIQLPEIIPTAEAATLEEPQVYDDKLYHGKDRGTWIFYLAVLAGLAVFFLRSYY